MHVVATPPMRHQEISDGGLWNTEPPTVSRPISFVRRLRGSRRAFYTSLASCKALPNCH
ncbi:hypothetical protein P692DRAFT_20840981, partial [Suillus brevipes Sb2]